MDELVKDLVLTDLIDVSILQRFQDAFSNMTGMAALTVDHEGRAVTEGSNFTDFCMKYTRESEVGRQRCEWCDLFGAQQTKETGKAETYFCHAGLIDYAAPIVVQGQQVGGFIGGQVLTNRPTDERVRQIARELGVDPEAYVEAAKKVSILPKNNIDRAAEFLQIVASVLSDMAYSQYMTRIANEEVMRADRMKSDFLANMSHEIRTPMNAVIGMAEMALREDLSPEAKSYITQIKSSGRELLRIINDILDFSKIESGKMDIIPVEYEALSIINDVANILMTRLKDKEVELILDLSPDIPCMLEGDNARIKQVLTNIANNGVKYTNEGKVTIHAGFEKISEDEVEMQISVEDTGIGIKEDDLAKLFTSFQQVDSKRNRNVEGTGLGLAIAKQLLTLMDGDIKVESEYGKGSTFSFNYTQKIVDGKPSIVIEDADKKAVLSWVNNEHIEQQLIIDCERLGVACVQAASQEDVLSYAAEHPEQEIFFILERKLFSDKWGRFANEHPEIKTVLLTDFFDTEKYNLKDVYVMKKPLYTLNLSLLLRGEDYHYTMGGNDDGDDFNYIAPEAEILVVDDNAVNLTVVEGLLEPLQLKIHTALSGKEAVDKISQQKFDLIFMDHMMPEMDGVETTRIIRRLHPEYNDVPIIALSANAVDGTKEMFLSEGMNDFVTKPIELRMLISKVKEWLPVEKIKKAKWDEQPEEETPSGPIVIGDLDTAAAIKLLGSEKLFWTILETYYKSIEKKADLIKELETKEDWAGYTIEVHSLKSFSKQVGAMDLSELAADMERAGNAREKARIHEETDQLVAMYRSYLPVLEPFFKKEEVDESEKEEITQEILQEMFTQLQVAIDDLDMDLMEETVEKMGSYRYPDAHKELFERMRTAMEEMDTTACEEIMAEWKSSL